MSQSGIKIEDQLWHEVQALQSQLTQEREAAEQLRREVEQRKQAYSALMRDADSRLCDCSHTLACGGLCSWCSGTRDTLIAKEAAEYNAQLTAALAERDRFRQEVLSQTGCDESEFDEAFHKLGKPVVNRRNGQVNQRWADALAERDELRRTLAEDCCSKIEANQRIANAQHEAAQIYNPLLQALEAERDQARQELEEAKGQHESEVWALTSTNTADQRWREEELSAAEKAIASLKAENEQLRAGAPLGPIIGAETIVEQELELKSLRQELEQAKERRKKYGALCDRCGWRGENRDTREEAMEDSHQHNKACHEAFRYARCEWCGWTGEPNSLSGEDARRHTLVCEKNPLRAAEQTIAELRKVLEEVVPMLKKSSTYSEGQRDNAAALGDLAAARAYQQAMERTDQLTAKIDAALARKASEPITLTPSRADGE